MCFCFFQNKILESKHIFIFLESYIEKFLKYFRFFALESLHQTDSANLLIPLSVKDFHKKTCRNFNVIFMRNASSNKVCIALGKAQNAENHKITTEK